MQEILHFGAWLRYLTDIIVFQEEVLAITMSKYRKVQAQLEDAERRADRAEAQNAAVVRHHTTVIGGGVGVGGNLGRPRAVSVTKEVTSRFIR